MSFKKFSAAQDTPDENRIEDKPAEAPTVKQPAAQPNKPVDDKAPAVKS